MMKPAELLSSYIIRQTHGSGIWITSHSSTSVTTHKHDKGDDMPIWFLYEVLTRTSRWDHYGRDQDTRKQKENCQIYKSQKDKYLRSSKWQEALKNRLDPSLQGYLELLRAEPQNSERQQPSSLGHQAQHAGVRLLETKVDRNGTCTGGRTTNDRINGTERRCRIHARDIRWKQFFLSEKLTVVFFYIWFFAFTTTNRTS